VGIMKVYKYKFNGNGTPKGELIEVTFKALDDNYAWQFLWELFDIRPRGNKRRLETIGELQGQINNL
jgi:hypothetical protein